MAVQLELRYPFSGYWRARNSPADRVPSHGTARFGLSYAIDFVPVDDRGRSAPYTPASFFRPEPPELFPGFGRQITAPGDGVIVGVHGAEPDHRSYRGLPSVGYALTQGRRLRAGWLNIIGNHVLLETRTTEQTAVVALCHLQHDSIAVRVGESVRQGQPIGRCGNSGNSTEPHLHVHAVAGRDVMNARAVPITFEGGLPHNGELVHVA